MQRKKKSVLVHRCHVNVPSGEIFTNVQTRTCFCYPVFPWYKI